MNLYERYRPTTWEQVVGQDKAVSALRAIVARGAGGRSFWFTGGSGTGKTTLARILAAEIADPFNVQELDATDCTPAKLTSIEAGLSTYGLGVKTGRAVIINEAHGLRKDSIRRLLVMLESTPPHVLWAFTTTNDGQEQLFDEHIDASPLLSRCLRVDLSRRGLADVGAAYVRKCCIDAGLDGHPLDRYVRAMKQERNNFRAVFERAEMGTI